MDDDPTHEEGFDGKQLSWQILNVALERGEVKR